MQCLYPALIARVVSTMPEVLSVSDLLAGEALPVQLDRPVDSYALAVRCLFSSQYIYPLHRSPNIGFWGRKFWWLLAVYSASFFEQYSDVQSAASISKIVAESGIRCSRPLFACFYCRGHWTCGL